MAGSAADVTGRALALSMLAAFVLAIVVARAIIQGGDFAVLLLVAVPLLAAVLWWRMGFVLALLMTAFFVAAVLALRVALRSTALGILPLLLLPFLVLALVVAWKVVRRMGPSPARGPRQVSLGEEE